MRSLLLFALGLFPFHLSAQGVERNAKLHFSNKIFVKVSPMTVLDNKGGLLPVSLEYTFLKDWGAQVDIGVPLMTTLLTNETKHIDHDYRIGIAVRRYFPFGSICRGFAGVEALYRRQGSTWGQGQYAQYDTHVEFSSANSVMQSKIISVITGIQIMMTRNLFFEPQIGLGYNSSENVWSNVQETRRYEAYVYAPGTREDHEFGSSARIYVPARITFSLLLGRNKNKRAD